MDKIQIIILLCFGISIIAAFFIYVIFKIVDYNRKYVRCTLCGWEGLIQKETHCCPDCGYFNWE